MSAEQFVAALSEYKLNPTEIADILWLALRQPQDEEEGVDVQETEGTSSTDDQQSQDDSATIPPPMKSDGDQQDDEGPDEEQGPTADIASNVPSGILPPKALPISVPDPGLLEETLPLVRALKPILKTIASDTSSYVDEPATVERIAETDIWSPVLQADHEPWFEVALVIDDSASMSLWDRLIQDIQRLLRCYGSFRDFRVWKLVVTDGQVSVCALPDLLDRPPKALLAPDSRRLVLVFSDCTADYWWDGTLQPVLAKWGKSTPVTIWQVLPDWMWKRTALGVGEYVAVRNSVPGATNAVLNPISLLLRPSKLSSVNSMNQGLHQGEANTASGESICLPVITTDGESIGAWSRMLAGDRRQPTPGFVLPATGWERNGDRPDHDADQQLEQFRLRATPEARRLAALLSAAPVITLPVMRLIRASELMFSGTSPLPVAEVFLGGLLHRVKDQPHQDDPEMVQYEFLAETRDRLLDVLPKVEAIEVIEAVSKYVAERLNFTLTDFRALLLSPDLREEADQYGLRTFAQVTAQILRRLELGPEYESLAAQLESPEQPQESDLIDSDAEWPDFPLETFEYEVAEYLNIPPLEDFEFIDAQFEEAIFPPPLQTEEFTIITVELQPQPEPNPEFEPFGFTVATLTRDGSDWSIERQQQTAYCLVEHLPEDITLEMVSIPAGTFLMGSPSREAKRDRRRESPQHEVTIGPFYMGRYPITQAQWRIVATLPRVERVLHANPSGFKNDDNPIECVTWYDAIEFCARLSAYTKRHYRLPTEAEWEYACRAGTTTPFHFGETLSSVLANYKGTTVYGDGPRGEDRNKTTPVAHFRVANHFGLSDMHGNVLEWCQDYWHEDYVNAPTDGGAWLDKGNSSYRALRGGSWQFVPWSCRAAYRSRFSPEHVSNEVGFRVCCSFW